MIIKPKIPLERKQEVLDWAYKFFSKFMCKIDFDYYILFESATNWSESILLLDDNDNILGLYLLGDHQITKFTDNDKFKSLNGIEGILLAIDESIRGKGWGDKLKDYPKTLGYDYIWGQQFKDLNNLKHWLKRRELITETKYIYITAEIF